MSPSVDGLSVIATKSPVVATHIGGFDEINTKQTQERYAIEALTYVRPIEISNYQERFLEKLINQKTSIGCIVAPFGYGKTSAAIDTWRICEQNGILAIPPFSCSSVAEMGKAIATGIMFRLGINTNSANRVKEAYEGYLISSARRLAEQDVEFYNINYEAALHSIEDKIERGFLQIEATGSHLLGFLEVLTQIVVESGFKGLLVIVDEFQQFLGNINKAVITNFRTLVWGLRTRGSLPLGLLITMDPDTERNLAERAGDILHRIKEDSLYLDFTDAYNREFARLLWAQYSEKFHVTNNITPVVDYAALDAIGQICERHDLSNGPRTVIDLFQRIAKIYPIHQRPYTPIDLIDDFMTGAIRFDGDRSKLASLVTELTSYEYIKSSRDRLQTLKLISAFPKGCSKEIATFYGLGQAFDQLSDTLRGEVLTELPEGIALIDLQKVGKPQNKLNIILKKYWMQITEDEIVTDRAITLFAKYVISPMFPAYKNILSGWSTSDTEYQLSPTGSYVQTYEGSFFEEYPKRKVSVELCRRLDQASLKLNDYNIHFIFVFQRSDEEVIRPIFNKENNTFILGITINQPFGMPMPRDVRWIEDYLRPVVMSPAVVLSLLEYINSQAPKIDGITENELQRIEVYSKKLNDYLISMIFGEELFSGLGIHIISRGEQALRHVLFHALRETFQGYRTLITSPQWENLCRAYIEALNVSTPIQNRGIEPLVGAKTKIASLFGFRNHAGFESQIRQFGDLVDLEEWSADQGTIRFKRHPGEDQILKTVALYGTMTEAALVDEAQKSGYLQEETIYLIKFLLLRGYIEQGNDGCYVPAQTLSQAELTVIVRESEEEAKEILSIVNLPNLANSLLLAKKAIEELNHQADISEIQIRILQFQRIVQESRSLAVKQIQNDLGLIRSNLFKRNEILKKDIPISLTGLALDAHINGAQRNIYTKCVSVINQINKLTQNAKDMLATLGNIDLSMSIQPTIRSIKIINLDFNESLNAAQQLIELINQHHLWVQLVDRLRWIKEYMQILELSFDIKTLSVQYDAIIHTIMEKLSVQGINVYFDLYSDSSPLVDNLYEEISTAIKATEIKNKSIESSNSYLPGDGEYSQELITVLLQENSFINIVQKSGLSPKDLIDTLVRLEKDGIVSIQFHPGNNK